MGIFAQLRDRRLFQIVASYLAAGWIGLEVFDQFVDRGIAHPVVYMLVLLAYVCGIPAAFLIGWYHGEKGEQKAPRSEIVMLTALALLFVTLSSFSVRNYRAERMIREAALLEAGLNLNSIGVLYFQDYTPGGEYQHVADALTEALIDELARVPALEVSSRNAAAHFADSDLPRDSIARVLGVGTLVGGIVEPRGNKLRITVRLFEGSSGNEVRSATIERLPEEMLAARDEVVAEVARHLRTWLGEEVRIRAGGQRIANAEAWTLYQRAEKQRKNAETLARERDLPGALASFARADSIATQAAVLAAEWPEPHVLQATTAYRRSRLAHDHHDIMSWADRALEHAEAALRLARNDARALEVRGTAKYWKYLQLQGREPEQAQRLLTDARRDLEEAVHIEPTLASAYSTLSHLLTRDDLSSALLAARRAYEADAYLEAAPDVLLRLVNGNYDLENFDQMQLWCNEGASRFAQNFRFTDCQLLLLTTRQLEPDVDQAWQLLARLESLSPQNRRTYDRVRGLTLVGGVIARASRAATQQQAMADSARRVLMRARDGITHETDPRQELLPLIAYMYTLLGETNTAIDLLRRYSAVNPAASYEHHWRWRELRGLPQFQPLLVERPTAARH